jgi:ABC-type thiamine transport system substrate-binding protein
VPADFDCFAIVNGKNQVNAYKFVNFALSKAAQESFASQALVLPASSDAAVPTALAPYAPTDLVYRYPDSAVVQDKLQDWVDRWNQEVQAR